MINPVSKEHNLKNLKDITDILNSYKDLEYFIFYGTLLGYKREQNIIEGDDDIDILINQKHWDIIANLCTNHPTFTHSIHSIPGKWFIQLKRELDGVETYIDFYFYAPDFDKKDHIYDKWESGNQNKNLNIPKDIIFPIQKSTMQGIEVNIPNKVEECCKLIYNDNYMTPLSKANNEYEMFGSIRKRKCCKITATYFGARRGYPKNCDDTIEMLTQELENELAIDTGFPTDLIIVNHDFGNQKAKDFLNQYDGMKTQNGIIKIIHRDWNDGWGLSFSSFIHGFNLFKDDYDYWFFNEDDIYAMEHGYIKRMIELLDYDDNVAYICAENISDHPHKIVNNYIEATGHENLPPHAHGGVGLTSTKYINEVIEKLGEFPLPKLKMSKELQQAAIEGDFNKFKQPEGIKWYRDAELNGELAFTNCYTKIGYKLQLGSGGRSFYRVQTQSYC